MWVGIYKYPLRVIGTSYIEEYTDSRSHHLGHGSLQGTIFPFDSQVPSDFLHGFSFLKIKVSKSRSFFLFALTIWLNPIIACFLVVPLFSFFQDTFYWFLLLYLYTCILMGYYGNAWFLWMVWSLLKKIVNNGLSSFFFHLSAFYKHFLFIDSPFFYKFFEGVCLLCFFRYMLSILHSWLLSLER